jgi:hypothetical protein
MRAAYPPHKSSYDDAVASALGALMSTDAVKSVCAERFPEFRDANDAAYKAWHKAQRKSVEDTEQHAKAVILENAQDGRDIADNVRALYEIRIPADTRHQFDDDPKGFRAACSQYPQSLGGGAAPLLMQ